MNFKNTPSLLIFWLRNTERIQFTREIFEFDFNKFNDFQTSKNISYSLTEIIRYRDKDRNILPQNSNSEFEIFQK